MTGPKPVLDSGLGAGQGIFEVSTTPNQRVGTRGSLSDGRVFYYARNSGASISAGFLCSAPAVASYHEGLATNTAQIGDPFVLVTFGSGSSEVANAFSGGYLCVTSSTGLGTVYTIERHAAVTSAATVDIYISDSIYLAFAAGTQAAVVKNRYADVALGSSTDTLEVPAGISAVAVPAGTSTLQYFWIQTWGVAVARMASSGIQTGQPLVHATHPVGYTGLVGVSPGITPEVIGTNLYTTASLETGPVFLKLSQ